MSSRYSTRQTGKPAEKQNAKSPVSSAERQWLIVVKGKTMDRIDIFQASGEAERADPSEETVINGAPYDAHQAIRSGAENPATPIDRPHVQIPEEIKRRQISLALRYVAALRLR